MVFGGGKCKAAAGHAARLLHARMFDYVILNEVTAHPNTSVENVEIKASLDTLHHTLWS